VLGAAKPPDRISFFFTNGNGNGEMQTTIRFKSKIRKRFMNALMKNGTSLRAIHNEIRGMLGIGGKVPWTSSWTWTWTNCNKLSPGGRSALFGFLRWKQHKNYDHKQDIGLRFYYSYLLVCCQ